MATEIELRQLTTQWIMFLVALGNDHRIYCGCTSCVHARYALGWY